MSNGKPLATPEMTEQLSGSEEVELNVQTGAVKPLPSQNPADPSPAASPEGAPAEPAGNAAETPPPSTATPPSATPEGAPPAPAVDPAAPKPAVEVIETPPQQAPASAPAPAPVQAEAPKEDMTAALKALAEYKDTVTEEARRSAQSAHDKQNVQFTRQLEAASAQAKELKAQVRDLANRDLTDAERAVAVAKYEQDDRAEELSATEAKLLTMQRETYVDNLMLEYAKYGVARDAVEANETTEEMEIFCLEQKAKHFETKLQENQAPAAEAAPAPAKPAEPAAPAAPAAPSEPNAPGVPPGALAPSDVGSTGVVAEGKKFSEDASPDAFRENLKNLDWNGVRISQ